MKIKILYKLTLLEEKDCTFTNFTKKVWDILENEFSFSIKNARYELFLDDIIDIENVLVHLNDKGYSEYLLWKSRVDKIENILNKI